MINFFSSFVFFILKILFKIYFFIFGEPKFDKSVEKVVELYNGKDFTGWFKKIRFWDAPYVEVEKFIPKKGLIIELGCGEGIFSNFMAITSDKRKILGIDLDRNRIKRADRGLNNVKFLYGDTTKINIPKANCIVMFHLLHHLASEKLQEKLIKKSSKLLKTNGQLIIVEVDNKPFLKYLISWFTDHLLVAWLFEKRFYEPNIFFRTSDEWKKLMKELDLKVVLKSMSKNKPFSHIFIAVKNK